MSHYYGIIELERQDDHKRHFVLFYKKMDEFEKHLLRNMRITKKKRRKREEKEPSFQDNFITTIHKNKQNMNREGFNLSFLHRLS